MTATIESPAKQKYRALTDVFLPDEFAELRGGILVGRVELTAEMCQTVKDCHFPTRPDGTPMQRPVRKHNLHKIVVDLSGGAFEFTGETIIFDDHAKQINGQHRTLAVLESGVPMDTLVVIGVPRRAFKVLDQGSVRSSATVMQMAGTPCARVAAAACRSLQVFATHGHFDSSGQKGAMAITLAKKAAGGIQQGLAVLEEHPVLGAIAAHLGRTSSSRSLVRYHGPCSAMFYVMHRVDPSLAKSFMDVLSIPEEKLLGLDPALLPIVQVRARLNNDRKMRLSEMTALCVKAWNNMRRGHSPKSLKWQSNEAYPLIDGVFYSPAGGALLEKLPAAAPFPLA